MLHITCNMTSRVESPIPLKEKTENHANLTNGVALKNLLDN